MSARGPRFYAPPMPRESGTVLVAALSLVLAAFAAMCAGWAPPAWARLAIGFSTFVLMPGLALALLLVRERDVEWPEWLAPCLRPGDSPSFAPLHGSFNSAGSAWGRAVWVLPAIAFVLWLIRMTMRRWRLPKPTRRGSRRIWITLGIAISTTVIWCSLNPTPIGIVQDSLDHMATARRMAETGIIFPTDTFYADAGETGADPRKGLYHVLIALLIRVTDLSPAAVWAGMAPFLSPFLVLAAYCVAKRAIRSHAAGAWAAGLTLLVYGGGLFAGVAMREAVYSTRVAETLSLLAVWAAWASLGNHSRRSAVVFILLGFAAIATHVFSAVYLAFGGGVLALVSAFAYRQLPFTFPFRTRREWFIRMGQLAFALALVCAPYLAQRYVQAYSPADPIHLETQGLLFWSGESFYTVTTWGLSEWLGLPLLGLFAALPLLWQHRAFGLGPIYLSAVPVAVYFVIANPLLLPLAHSVGGYLVLRLVWCVPLAAALGVGLVLAARNALGPASPTVRKIGLATMAVIGLTLVPPLYHNIAAWLTADSRAAREHTLSPEQWSDLTQALRNLGSERSVILADPPTSYAIPALTGHAAVNLMPQHASPNDPLGEQRIVDARDALSPFVSDEETLEILRRYDVDYIVLNHRIQQPIVYGPWLRQPALFGPGLAKFDRHAQWYERVWSNDGIYLYRVTDAARQATAVAADTQDRSAFEIPAEAIVEGAVEEPGIVHVSTTATARRVAPGESVELVTHWQPGSGEPRRPGAYWVIAYLVREPTEGGTLAHLFSKPLRVARERWTGERVHQRSNHVPIEGYWPPDRWEDHRVYVDRYKLPIPADLLPGLYTIRVRLERRPHHLNQYLADFFIDPHYTRGESVYVIEVGDGASGGPVTLHRPERRP